MQLMQLKRFLDEASAMGNSLTVPEIAAGTGLTRNEIAVMLDILGWRQRVVEAQPASCSQGCQTCPLNAVCSAGAFTLNVGYRQVTPALKK
jgi:hypothetical protein